VTEIPQFKVDFAVYRDLYDFLLLRKALQIEFPLIITPPIFPREKIPSLTEKKLIGRLNKFLKKACSIVDFRSTVLLENFLTN